MEFIRKYQMIRPGDSVCVGFSGGADSVCLLELLYELREELSIRLEAVHVNHNAQGGGKVTEIRILQRNSAGSGGFLCIFIPLR